MQKLIKFFIKCKTEEATPGAKTEDVTPEAETEEATPEAKAIGEADVTTNN